MTDRVDEEKRFGKNYKHIFQAVLDLLLTRNSGRVNVVYTGANLVWVAVSLESLEKLHVTLGGFNRDDISVKALNGGEDIVEVGVTEVWMSLERVGDTSGGEFERVNSPFEVVVPIRSTER
jgi:hypothetical protein